MKDIDKKHIWHPYSAVNANNCLKVEEAHGVYLTLDNGQKLIDGMSSWWSVIHGYNHPQLNQALIEQTAKMSHVMFGGLTHQPAIELTQKLLSILDDSFEHIFYCDSGSVSIEVAMKMALQYHYEEDKTTKNRFLTVKKGYHGDTFGAMSVCDPVTGMHSIFNGVLHENFFVKEPLSKFGEPLLEGELDEIIEVLKNNHSLIAAIIIEPVVQGAGGMRMYSVEYLKALKQLCKEYDVLLIFDEIATGFGRTGKMFAYEHAGITPDIMTIGKALTGGYMTMAATITTAHVAEGIEKNGNILMHGPTFMGNPLACSVALSSIDVLLESGWQDNVQRIEKYLNTHLSKCESLDSVKEVRVLGAIGVVELKENVDMQVATKSFVQHGVWIRPFGKLMYIMPPYIIQNSQLQQLIDAIYETINILEERK